MSNKGYYAIVDTPTKRHHFVFSCEGAILDNTARVWLNEKLERHFWNTETNESTPFVVLQICSIVGDLVEIKFAGTGERIKKKLPPASDWYTNPSSW